MTSGRERTVGEREVRTQPEVGAEAIDISPNQDRGVLKVIKQEGIEGEIPMIGDKVYVHYTGTLLDGRKFDSSRDRKEQFAFNLGKGQVLKAWDIGIASMKKGEICQLFCKPTYAYGASGSPPKIPPNSTLVFEVELIQFKGEDLTEGEDGGIIRRIKKKGEGYFSPNEGATVEVSIQGKCQNVLFDRREVKFVVGEGDDRDIPIGVDKAVEKMQRGEQCLVHLKSKYGFGEKGRPEFNIPPNCELDYELELRRFQKAKESWEMHIQEKLDRAATAKLKGTSYYKAGKYIQAVIQYRKIVMWLEQEYCLAQEDRQYTRALLLPGHLNMAMCYLKLNEHLKAVESCNKALEMDGSNEKGLYRRGEARLHINEFDLAKADFQRVIQVNPHNRAARTQLLLCQRRLKAHHERNRKIYANMFQKFAERDQQAEAGNSSRHKSSNAPEQLEDGSPREKKAREAE
uniref:peptidylprolyl isomerase n=1 Tax=Callorhinchus milii TaxID=7868 RepID=V9KPK9_CALMI|eukprot:gi/632967164/ref/XP_007899824.1/ PREDICTED: peptidyl-prolyl cis-trans isomerase FKBP5-like [Callorhinchus milii]